MGRQTVAQGNERQEPLAQPWVSVPINFLLSPLIACLLADSGGEVGRGGNFVTEWELSRFVVPSTILGTKRDFRK